VAIHDQLYMRRCVLIGVRVGLSLCKVASDVHVHVIAKELGIKLMVWLDDCLLSGTCKALARKASRASFPYSFAKSRSMKHHHHHPPAIASLHTHAHFSVTSPFLSSPSLCRLPPVRNITCITSRIWQCPYDLPPHSTLAHGRISIHGLIRAQYI
jgi:hypothetical protein